MSSADVDVVPVVIVGGGPVGTVLSALLSRNYKIPNVVLEKETEIAPEPRAFALGEHGIRVLQSIGLYKRMYSEIGMAVSCTELVSGTHHDFHHPPFMRKTLSHMGVTGHHKNSRFKQPTLEPIVRELIEKAEVGEFRDGCEVVEIRAPEDEEFAYVKYTEKASGALREIKTRFVIATDGRRGFTRKRYLEPKGIKLERSHPYRQVFVGANWHVTMPTPDSHPDFPLWKLGYSPEDVAEEFFPFNMMLFCNPERQLVSARVGLRKDNPFFYRTELSTKESEDPLKLATPETIAGFVKPYMTHRGSRYGLSEDVTYPSDCMKIERVWHYAYEYLTANTWNVGRVMLAGDSAHVMAPFGGLGITTGTLDVSALAWRLSIALEPSNVDRPFSEISPFFTSWAEERKNEMAQTRGFTTQIGAVFVESNPIKVFVRDLILLFLRSLPVIKTWIETLYVPEMSYGITSNPAFCSKLHGGRSLYQVFCRRLAPDSPVIWSDDVIYDNKTGLFQLLVLVDHLHETTTVHRELQRLGGLGDVAALLLTEATFIVHDLQISATDAKEAAQEGLNIARVATAEEFVSSELCAGRDKPAGYNHRGLNIHYGGCRFVVARRDRIVFAACNDIATLMNVIESIHRVYRCEAADG